MSCICVNTLRHSSWTGWLKSFTVDPSSSIYYRWLMVVSVAVVYNLLVVVARTIFWKLHGHYALYWLVADYVADCVYLTDIVINLRTGITSFITCGL